MRCLAPAKINLFLRVAEPDSSGFHGLFSWMAGVAFFDELMFELTGPPGVRLVCDRRDIPCDASNLICRAACAVLREAHMDHVGMSIQLKKRIPIGGGLGGGSSNAAITLLAVSRLCKLGVTGSTLHRIAASLGSDVPFFLRLPSASARGRGEILSVAPTPDALRVLLVFPPMAISTPLAYRTLDLLRPAAPPDTLDDIDLEAWSRLPALALLQQLQNDLERPAWHLLPELASLRQQIQAHLGRPVRMSGSGSTLFTFFDTAEPSPDLIDLHQRFGCRFVVTDFLAESFDPLAASDVT